MGLHFVACFEIIKEYWALCPVFRNSWQREFV
jgi:hypothetical protein